MLAVILGILVICFEANIGYSVFNTLVKNLYQFWKAPNNMFEHIN